MYTPKHFRMEDKSEMFRFIEQNSFGMLITSSPVKLKAVHLPMILSRDSAENGILYGHVSAANDVLNDISGEALAIFQGAHSYISSSWYESYESVPTWNYLAVHAYGNVRILHDHARKLDVVGKMVRFYEAEDSPYRLSELNSEYLEKQLKGIIAFEFEISKLEGKMKLSQNHSPLRQSLIIENLEKDGGEDAIEIAGLMKRNLKERDAGIQ